MIPEKSGIMKKLTNFSNYPAKNHIIIYNFHWTSLSITLDFKDNIKLRKIKNLFTSKSIYLNSD